LVLFHFMSKHFGMANTKFFMLSFTCTAVMLTNLNQRAKSFLER